MEGREDVKGATASNKRMLGIECLQTLRSSKGPFGTKQIPASNHHKYKLAL